MQVLDKEIKKMKVYHLEMEEEGPRFAYDRTASALQLQVLYVLQ